MNKNEWLAAFQSLNGRAPEEAEITAALQNGDFVEEVTEKVAPAEPVWPSMPFQEAPAEAPVQPEQPAAADAAENPAPAEPVWPETPAQAEPAEQVAQAAQPVWPQAEANQAQPQAQATAAQQAAQPFQPVAPQQPTEAALFFKNLWSWFVSALKRPSSEAEKPSLVNSIISGLVMTLFSSFAMYAIWLRVRDDVYGEIRSALHTNFFDSTYSVGSELGVVFKIFFALTLLMVVLVATGYLVRRFIYGNEKVTFVNSLEYYARLYSVPTALAVLSTLFGMIGLATFASILLYIIFLTVSAGYSYSIAQFDNKYKLDKVYVFAIGLVVSMIVFFIALLLIAAILG